MRNKPTAESSHGIRQALTVPAVIAAVFLGLHVLPLFWQPNPMWGLDFLFYMPAPIQGLFVVLAVLLFVPGFRRQSARGLARSIPLTLWGRGQRVWASRILVSLTALAAFVALSSARHFLGDGYSPPGTNSMQAQTGKTNTVLRSPSRFYPRPSPRESAPSGKPRKTRTGFTATLSGTPVRSTIRRHVAGTLGKQATPDRSIVLAFLLTDGHSCNNSSGTWRITPSTCPVLLLYILSGLAGAHWNSVRPCTAPRLLLGLHAGSAFHRLSLVILGPSLLYTSRTGPIVADNEKKPTVQEITRWPLQPPFAAFPLAPLFSWG